MPLVVDQISGERRLAAGREVCALMQTTLRSAGEMTGCAIECVAIACAEAQKGPVRAAEEIEEAVGAAIVIDDGGVRRAIAGLKMQLKQRCDDG